MARRIIPWLPWLLAVSVLAFLQARLWPEGGFLLLVIWTIVLLFYRAAAVQIPRRTPRVLLDLAFAGLCFLAAFEGGWYVLPAVAAFVACDAAGLSIRLPSLPPGRDGHELGAALAGAVLGWLGLAIAVSPPLYATATTSLYPDGTVVSSGPQLGLLQTSVNLPTAVLLVALVFGFGMLAGVAAIDVRRRRPGLRVALAAVAGLLTLLAALAVPVVGLWPVPGAALALAAAWIARPRSSPFGTA